MLLLGMVLGMIIIAVAVDYGYMIWNHLKATQTVHGAAAKSLKKPKKKVLCINCAYGKKGKASRCGNIFGDKWVPAEFVYCQHKNNLKDINYEEGRASILPGSNFNTKGECKNYEPKDAPVEESVNEKPTTEETNEDV